MSELIEEVLGSSAIEVVIPAKSIEIDPHFNKEKFDVVLIGLSTSPENDVELIREIRRSGFNQTTPIILISADQRPSSLSLGFEAGATFFVYKPIDRVRLMDLIRSTEGTTEHERGCFRLIPSYVLERNK